MVDVRFGRAVGPALLAAAAASIVALAAALPASAAVTVSVVDGNPTCGDLATGTTELKIEPVADGPYAGGGLSVTIDVRDTPDGQVFDWTASQAVDMVVAKGGSEAAVYTYSPEVTSDTGLHSPINSSEKWAGLSHVSLCFDADSLTPPSNPPINAPSNPPSNPPTGSSQQVLASQGAPTSSVLPSTATGDETIPIAVGLLTLAAALVAGAVVSTLRGSRGSR
jgi:hypothetical protein